MNIDKEAVATSSVPTEAGLRLWAPIVVLLALYTISFVDRTILTMLVPSIQKDLRIGDFQASLLLGPAFSIFYVVCGLPMGKAVDTYPRKLVVLFGVVTWSLATVFSGFATTFVALLLLRMGLGLGESVLSPAAHAVIGERFPKRRLSTAMSVFSIGSAIGAGLAVALGGLLAQLLDEHGKAAFSMLHGFKSWQLVMLAIGFATILLSPLALLVPRSRLHEDKHVDVALDHIGLLALVKKDWVLYVVGPVGFAFINSITSAYTAWGPTFMMRTYEWSPARVGVALGLQHSVAGGLGFLVTAAIVDRWYSKGVVDAHVRFPVYSILICVPLSVVGLVAGNPWGFLLLTTPFYLLCYGWLGYAAASLQIFSPGHLRGQVSALLLAITSLVGMGFGPPLTGLLTDVVFGDKAEVGFSLAVSSVLFGTLSIALLLAAARRLRILHGKFDGGDALNRRR